MSLQPTTPTAHGEIVAIRDAAARLGRFDLSDCLFITTCNPCPICLGAILWARIPKIVIGATRHDAANAGFDNALFYEKVCAKQHFIVDEKLHTQAVEMLQEWRENPASRYY
ncbi:MAG: nucleoside deaminase [Campylobacterales bacterium]